MDAENYLLEKILVEATLMDELGRPIKTNRQLSTVGGVQHWLRTGFDKNWDSSTNRYTQRLSSSRCLVRRMFRLTPPSSLEGGEVSSWEVCCEEL